VGELPSYVSPIDAKLYAEYNIPYFTEVPWAHNFILTGGISYTGPFHAQTGSATNLAGIVRINGFSTGDIGFRYVTKINDHPFTLRFTVTNFTNAAYWANWGTWGQPRTFLATAEIKW
jgi:iron complex outermembrane receptor protein